MHSGMICLKKKQIKKKDDRTQQRLWEERKILAERKKMKLEVILDWKPPQGKSRIKKNKNRK